MTMVTHRHSPDRREAIALRSIRHFMPHPCYVTRQAKRFSVVLRTLGFCVLTVFSLPVSGASYDLWLNDLLFVVRAVAPPPVA